MITLLPVPPERIAEIETWDIAKLQRKADQAWEMAGCARRDRDAVDEARWTAEAKFIDERVASLR